MHQSEILLPISAKFPDRQPFQSWNAAKAPWLAATLNFRNLPAEKCAYLCIGTHLSALLYHNRDSTRKGPARVDYHTHVMIEL